MPPPIIDAQGLESLRRLLDLHDITENRTRDEQRPWTQAPEVYIAKAQTTIPALLPAGLEGTGTGSGTSTAAPIISGSAYDEPGVATCSLYTIIIDNTSGDPELHAMAANQKVYNISAGVIASEWLLVIRDKWGRWIASPSSTTGEAVTVVTDIRIDVATLTLQMKTRSVKILPLAAESEWTTIHTGVSCSVGTATATATP